MSDIQSKLTFTAKSLRVFWWYYIGQFKILAAPTVDVYLQGIQQYISELCHTFVSAISGENQSLMNHILLYYSEIVCILYCDKIKEVCLMWSIVGRVPQRLSLTERRYYKYNVVSDNGWYEFTTDDVADRYLQRNGINDSERSSAV